MMAAAIVTLLFLSVPFPTMSLACAALAGFMVMIVLVRWGSRAAMLCYITAAFLSMILLPRKDAAVEFLLIYGPYTCIRDGWFDRIKNKLVSWLYKMVYCNGVLFIYYSAARILLALPKAVMRELLFVVPLFNLAFVLLDISYTKYLRYARTHYARML